MNDAEGQRHEPSLTTSIIRVIEAGQRLILDRLDLAYFDLSQLATRTLYSAALIVGGTVLLIGAWFTVLLGLVTWLQAYMSLPAVLFLVAGLNAAGGAAAIAIGLQRTRTTAAATLGDMVADLRGSNVPAPAPVSPLGMTAERVHS